MVEKFDKDRLTAYWCDSYEFNIKARKDGLLF